MVDYGPFKMWKQADDPGSTCHCCIVINRFGLELQHTVRKEMHVASVYNVIYSKKIN